MRRLLVTLAALSAGTALAQGKVDPKIAEFCMKATDFAGCVQTMTGGLPPKQKTDVEEGLRTWTRDDGTIVRFRVDSVTALKHEGTYGRYLEFRYGLERKNSGSMWGVQADCKDYTANWDQDSEGWKRLNDPSMYLRPGEPSSMNQPAREAKAVLDEFCPIIDTLPKGGDI